jgi:hypothetical protein
MATLSGNRAWNLESFLDSLIIELDKARDTLAVKGLTRPLTYSVQDLDLELQIFPQYDGEQIRFVTAQPGESGASELKVQLGSITSRSIKETTSDPITKDDISIDAVEELDHEAKQSLRKLGIKSSRDLERIEDRQVDLEKVTNKKLDYGKLANLVNKAKRRGAPPSVGKVEVSEAHGGDALAVEGSNLALAHALPEFPIATIDGRRVEVLDASPGRVIVKVEPERLAGRTSRLQIALDPFAIVNMELKG